METLAIIGLVGNVVQLVDFSAKLVLKSAELYQSSEGALAKNSDIETAINHLVLLNNNLKDAATTTSDSALQGICKSCGTTADQLLAVLDEVNVKVKQGKWKSIRKALRSVWRKEEIQELGRRLERFREELNLHVIVDLREEVRQFMREGSDRPKDLDITTKRIVDAIIKQEDVFRTAHNTQITLVGTIHEETISKIQDEHAITRRDKIQEIRRRKQDMSSVNQELCLATSSKTCWYVPLHRNKNFVGRSAQLNELEASLFTKGHCSKFAIIGLGGVGKTQIALELAYRIRDKHPDCSVFWVLATSTENLQQAYVEVGQKLRIIGLEEKKEDIKKLVQHHLSQESAGQWLLILDNADDMDMWFKKSDINTNTTRLIDYLPRSSKGSIVFTTRNRKAAVKFAGRNVIQVTEMDKDTATQVLRNSLINKEILNDHAVVQLLRQLTFLPLAIVQAAAYINENDISLVEYLSLLDDREENIVEVLSEDFEDEGRYHDIKNPIATTWLISFEQIRIRDSLAADYLSFMSCIDPKAIPLSLLPPARSKKRIVDAIGTLSTYLFITKRSDDQSLDIHRLVHLATRNWLREQNSLSEWVAKAIAQLANVFPNDNYENRILWRTYLPHAQYIYASGLSKENFKGSLLLLQKFGLCLLSDGRWDEAEKPFMQVMEASVRVLGQEHPDTLTSMDNLASTYRNQGRWKEAEELDVQVAKTKNRVLGQEHPSTLTSMTNLASTYRNQGRWKEAEELDVQVMETSVRVLGQEHPDTLTSMTNLASTYRNQGRWKEAEELEVQVMETRRRVPSLTSGPTVESAHWTLDKNHTKESPMPHDTVSDVGSVISALPAGASQEEREQIVKGFAHAIAEKFRNQQLKFSTSSVSQERAKQVFASKLKRYSKVITDDMPQTIEFTRKRNAAKTVFWYRSQIVNEFVRVTFPAPEQEQETDRARTALTNETIQESFEEKVSTWRVDSTGFYEDLPYPPDQKSDEAMDIYASMELEPVDDPDPVMERDHKAIREHLMTHEEFDILESALKKVARHYYSDTMKLIQTSILGNLGVSMTCFTANFRAKWNIREFIKEQYGSELQDIRHILAITGNCHDAQMTTVGCYLEQTWPGYPSALIDKLQLLILGSYLNEQKEDKLSQPNGDLVDVSVAEDTVTVNATGSAEFLCAIGQQLAWLGAVCQISKNGLCYCDTVWTHNLLGVSSAKMSFELEYDVISFDKDEIKLCWHSLIGDSVVATGFPIPERSYNNKGLQVPIEIMAALGGVSIAVDVRSGFYLKGEAVAFIPVERKDDRVQWHLVDRGGKPLDYEYLEKQRFKPLTLSELDGEAINSTTAFLGWTPHVMNLAATDKIEYSHIKWSGSCATPEIAITPSGGSVTFSKVIGLGLNFQIGRKQTSPSTQPIKDYSDILHDLRDRSVIFYDTATRRSWLIDAERATLQIILHRSKTRGKNFIAPDVKFEIANAKQAASARSAMESNQQVKLREGWDAIKGKKIDIWFSASVKELWEILKALAYKAQSEYKRCFHFADIGVGNKGFVGFEYMGLVESSAELEQQPMKVKLDTDCGEWPDLANDLGAVVLLARNFQEVLLPPDEVTLCPKFRKLPSNKSYIATEVATIRKLIKQFSAHSGQKRLTATNIGWIVSKDIFTPCNQQNGGECFCRRVQELRKLSGSRSESLGEPWEGGAIIFGARVTNRLQKGPGTGKRQQPPSRGPEAVSSLIAAASKTMLLASLPSTRILPNEKSFYPQGFSNPGRRLGSNNESTPQDSSEPQADGKCLFAHDAARRRWADYGSGLSRNSGNEQLPEPDSSHES